MVKSKLPPRSGFGLEAGEPHPQKWAIKFFFFWSSFIFYFRGNYKRSNISFPPPPFRYDNVSTIEREYLIFYSIFALTGIVLQFWYYLEQWFCWRKLFNFKDGAIYKIVLKFRSEIRPFALLPTSVQLLVFILQIPVRRIKVLL